MFISDEFADKWISYVNENVENEEDGAIIYAEKARAAEAKIAGSNDEVERLISIIINTYALYANITFDEAIAGIKDKWEELKNKNSCMAFSDEKGETVYDPKTGIGFNEKENTVVFPAIPKDVEEAMISSCKRSDEKFQRLEKYLHDADGLDKLGNIFSDLICYSSKEDKETDSIRFKIDDDIYMYCVDFPDRVMIQSENSISDHILEDYEFFESFVRAILNIERS